MIDPQPRSTSARWLLALTALVLSVSVAPARAQTAADARLLVERAVESMGGEAELRAVERVAMNMMTVWFGASFEAVPHPSRRRSFEEHTDVRDYTRSAWRNTRRFPRRNIVNVVVDSVAVTDFGNGFGPLSSAYVDERRELFAYTPDRMILMALDAPDLALAFDTMMGQARYRVVTATLADRFPARIYLHEGTGLPRRMTFQAAHPNDWGLVPWGEMEVSVWYSQWRTFDSISIPTQWDIDRVGIPYKSLHVRSAAFDPVFAADSFAVSDELRLRYVNEASLPMHEYRTIDSTTTPAPGLIAIHGFGFPRAAVDIGTGWLVLEAGQAPSLWDQAERTFVGVGANEIVGVLATQARTANGGVSRAVRMGLPIYVSRASESFVRKMLENRGITGARLTIIDELLTVGRPDRAVFMAPVDLPDVSGSMMLFHPRTGWLYSPDALTPLDVQTMLTEAVALGWEVDHYATVRSVWIPN